jgi:phosphoglycolate phosphatase
MNFRKVVFLDLDGTLTDSGPGIINSFNFALDRLGLPPLPENPDGVVGPSLWESFPKYGVKSDQIDLAIAAYRECYRGGEMLNNRLYEGIIEQLSTLKDAGYGLCLATSKPIAYAAEITAHFGLSAYLDEQVGSELDGSRSEKRDLLTYGLEKMCCGALDSIMVGDRHYDVNGACAVGMPCLGALYGYGTRDELIDAGAIALLNTAHDLATSVRKHLPIGE